MGLYLFALLWMIIQSTGFQPAASDAYRYSLYAFHHVHELLLLQNHISFPCPVICLPIGSSYLAVDYQSPFNISFYSTCTSIYLFAFYTLAPLLYIFHILSFGNTDLRSGLPIAS